MGQNRTSPRGLLGKHHVCDCQGRPFYIVFPADGQTVTDLETVRGTGAPEALVLLSVDDHPPLTGHADGRGGWAVSSPYRLESGEHRLCATQCTCCCLCDCIRVRVRTPPADETAPEPQAEPSASENEPNNARGTDGGPESSKPQEYEESGPDGWNRIG